jgi:hypothetical protein
LGATKGTTSTKIKVTKSGRRVGLRSRPTAGEVRHPEQAGWIVVRFVPVWRTSPVAAFGGPGDRALWTLTFVLFVSLVASVFVIFVA